MGPLVLLALVGAGPGPTDQALIHYNARMALREGRTTEALKLWLLRNAVESETHEVSAQDEEFRSVTWAALGKLGLCPEGFPTDEAGVGLWPLALHNWLVRNMRRAPPLDGPSPFESFSLGRQQRWVSLHDVLDATELQAVTFRRSACFASLGIKLDAGVSLGSDVGDRRVTAGLLRHLLRRSLQTLDADRVVGRAVVEARLFDLNLRMSGLQQRANRRARREERREARRKGLSKAELVDQRKTEPRPPVPADSEAGALLRASLSWPVEEWMTLSADRRQFLFDHALRLQPDSTVTAALKLAVIDALIEAGHGSEVQSWIAHLTAAGDPESKRLIWDGERGRRLLGLDPGTGFRERAVIALQRGVAAMAAGDLPESLRSIAHAVRWSESSRAADEVRNLGRRWLSFVAAQFRVTDELFAMLRSVVPRGDYRAVIEDQLWHAALRADAASFDRCVAQQKGRGALARRVLLISPLARGDAGAFEDAVAERMTESPHASLGLLKQYVERLQAEDAEVRMQHAPSLERLKAVLEATLAEAATTGRRLRQADLLVGEMRALVEGVGRTVAPSEGDKAHALSPDRAVFGGSLRVAPSDELPWAFRVADVKAPPVFTPVALQPLEWRNADGDRIFGWRIGD